jgi:hypothetical protein
VDVRGRDYDIDDLSGQTGPMYPAEKPGAEAPLCMPKTRFCHTDGEGRQGQVVRRRRRGAQSRDGEGRPC